MRKIKGILPPAWSQGYHPDRAILAYRKRDKNHYVCAGYRPCHFFDKNRYTLILASGFLLLVCGLWILAQPLSDAANRQKAEMDLRNIYYAAASQEAVKSPVATALAERLPTVKPVQNATLGARTFATPVPMLTYVTRDRFLSLLKLNSDVIGWLTIQDELDLPVVQRDNSYYLTHNFQGAVSYSGTLFLDRNFSIVPPHENFLIHGHNMRDGSMFGLLLNYRKKGFYIKHWLIQFETLYENGSYAVFAAFDMVNDPSDPTYFPYSYSKFDTDLQFENYIAGVKKRSLFQNNLSILPTDTLLTLSTCAGGNNHYLVLVARKIREGESLSSITTTCLMSTFE